jgi:hypothetical protein
MMDIQQILGTGGISGAVVVCCYFVYLLCKRKKSRCRSGCCSVDVSADSPGYACKEKETGKEDVKVELPKDDPKEEQKTAPKNVQ